MAQSAVMTDTTREDEQGSTGDDAPSRQGKRWTEDDCTALMRACRDGCDIDEIARRVGRTPQSAQGQLRRLLPLDERHLPNELALARLRQLDADGDYDWLAALAQRTKSAWELRVEAEAAHDARGIGALADDELVTVALALASSSTCRSTSIAQRCGHELHRRGIGEQVCVRAARAAEEDVHRLLREPLYADRWDDSAPLDWRPDERIGGWPGSPF